MAEVEITFKYASLRLDKRAYRFKENIHAQLSDQTDGLVV